ncbi:hypothetical protein [Sphingopyxis sp. MWB1]|uniref:hypothetical protein n=1 Tax=Sphingopyxis sp. MWB1 TaxID=1537715 RepID=UPI00051A451D|nr:hypothetical protein [Sphingopyxis sp. MWB1]
MRFPLFPLALSALLAVPTAAGAKPGTDASGRAVVVDDAREDALEEGLPPFGDYRIADGPDVGGGLRIAAEGHFFYRLVAGALDQRAEGRWEKRGEAFCLITEPKPIPPLFSRVAPVAVDGRIPTIFASWPRGTGIAGIDFVIGFDEGEPIHGYTQTDGWMLPAEETRTPRWVEVREPVHDVTAPRFLLDESDGGRLHVRLTPNHMGIMDFDGTSCVQRMGDAFRLDHPDGPLRLQWMGGEE